MIRRVLLVEDDPGVAAALTALLEDMGWSVRGAGSAREAYLEFAAFAPDAVLLDVDLPDASGLDVLRQLKELSDVPVIMISGVETPERIAESRLAGAERFMLKPFSYEVLEEALGKEGGKLGS